MWWPEHPPPGAKDGLLEKLLPTGRSSGGITTPSKSQQPRMRKRETEDTHPQGT